VISAVRKFVLILAVASVASCSWFGGDDEKELEPMKLTDIVTSVSVKRVWSVKIGKEAEFLRVALRPFGDGNRLYAASRDGNVVALQPKTGKEVWRTGLEIELSAGPGVGSGLVVVAAANGFMIALDADSGTEKWRADVSGEVLAVPGQFCHRPDDRQSIAHAVGFRWHAALGGRADDTATHDAWIGDAGICWLIGHRRFRQRSTYRRKS